MAVVELDYMEYANDAAAQAAYVSSDITAYDSYTKACSHFDGADEATAYTDPIAGAYTFVGTAQLDTAQKVFGTAALLLDGNSDLVSLPDSANFDLANGNFSIEGRYRFTSVAGNDGLFQKYAESAGNREYGAYRGVDKIVFYFSTDGTNNISVTWNWSPSINTWYHIAIVRNGADLNIYVDGSQLDWAGGAGNTYNIGALTIYNGANALFVGSNADIGWMGGWVEEFRFSKGIARWTANFTPDTAAYPTQSGGVLQCYSEDTIIQQGSYSLKIEAKQTGSLNETLTKSGLSIDLTDKEEIKLWAYALRTGTHIQIQIHDSGGQTSTKDIVISQADTWTEITWDISGISNANKDDIDEIIIKIINADVGNTFYVDNFRAEESLQCYSEDTIKVQGDYSLKVVAAQTGSLNKTLTKTLTDYLDYSIQDVIKFDVRASRTGTNIQLQIHDTGGTTSSHNINIASANVWQTETWDISGITGTDRDTIDKIIIKVSEATVANTIYMDNLYSQVIVESAHVFIGG